MSKYLYFTCDEHGFSSIHGAVGLTVSERREFHFMSLKNTKVYFLSVGPLEGAVPRLIMIRSPCGSDAFRGLR